MKIKIHPGFVIGILALITASSSYALDNYFKTQPVGEWLSGTWSQGRLPVEDTAMMTSSQGGTAIVSQAGAECLILYVSRQPADEGELRIEEGGYLAVKNLATIGYRGRGKVVQTGGFLAITNTLRVGSFDNGSIGIYTQSAGGVECAYALLGGTIAGSTGIYYLTGSGVITNRAGPAVGNYGVGIFNQSGGRHVILGSGYMSIGAVAGSKGFYNLSGGDLIAPSIAVGEASEGYFNHSGGTCSVNSIVLGNVSGGKGVYSMTGGEIRIQKGNKLVVGSQVNTVGVFLFGDAHSSGSIVEVGESATGAGLQVVNSSTAKGVFRGWGVVSLTDFLTVSGQVIADGYGTDRLLDLSSLSRISQPHNNTTTNGWYALNRGKLRLPRIIISGNGTYYWGENSSLDLVNAVKFNINGSGTMTGELLASDCSGIPALGPLRPMGIWNFSGTTGSSGSLSIRYDHAAAEAAGIDEANLKLYRSDGGAWENVTSGTVDTVSRTISTLSVNPNGWYAVAVPAGGTLIMIK